MVGAHEVQPATRHLARAALSGCLIWTAVEFAIRVVAAALSALALARLRGTDLPPDQLAALSYVPLVPAMLALWMVFDRRIRSEGLSSRDLGYRLSSRGALAGLVSGPILLGLVGGAHSLDSLLFAQGPSHILEWLGAADSLVILAFLVGNGILTPVVEEFVWRGYIQSHLERAWNPITALVATALLFAIKHMVVDTSVTRAAALVAASAGLGVVRMRWGTSASTLAHLTMNFCASALVVIEALRR